MASLFKARCQFAQRHLKLRDFALILVNVIANFGSTLARLLKVPGLPLAQFMRVLDRLFQPRNLCANFIETTLHLVKFVAAIALAHASALDTGLLLSLLGYCGLESRLPLAQFVISISRALIKIARS